MTMALTRHIHVGADPGSLASEAWASSPVTGAPPVTPAMEAALRRQVMDQGDKLSEPVKWHHCEGWGAVLDLHRAGRHNDALDLARLLHWCDRTANGRIQGFWEITPAAGEPA